MSIMLVDDTGFIRSILRDILLKEGYTKIYEAEDGIDCIEMYKEHFPSVVLMDITMPNKNGLDCLKELMKIDPDAKVIMCTAMGQRDMVKKAVQYGAVDFIVKPFQEDRVIDAVKRVLG